MNTSFVASVAAQAISAIRPSFHGKFRLASSPVIEAADLSGVRLRWNFPLFNQDGTFARCLPDRVVLHRKLENMDRYFRPSAPDVGLEPIGLYYDFAWTAKSIVQVGVSPYSFEFRDRRGASTTVEGISFGYRGDAAATLRVIGIGGHCIVITLIQPGETFYFDAAEILRFEIETAGNAALSDARCLDIGMLGEVRLDYPISELEIRRPLSERLSVDEGALRLNGAAGSSGASTSTLPQGQQFLDSADWSELMDLASEISANACSGPPELVDVDGSYVARTDLFLAAAASRWEMAPRLGFGFRDGENPSTSRYDQILASELDITVRDQVVMYQLEAFWDSTGESQRSTIASTRLDKRFSITEPASVRYLAPVDGKIDSDYISIDLDPANPLENASTGGAASAAQTTLNWQHNNFQRPAGIMVEETYSGTGKPKRIAVDWLQHRGVYNEGFRGNVRRFLPVSFDEEVTSKIWSFDSWDQLSQQWIEAAPTVVLGYEPEAPKLACATHLASLEEENGKILIERLVTTQSFRPSTLSGVAVDGVAPLEFPEWTPEALMLELVQLNYRFHLGIFEAVARPKTTSANLTLYARDGLGSFVEFDQQIDLTDFVDGFLDAPNGRYHVRSTLGTRLYIGRMGKDLSVEFDEATCQITSSALNIDETDEPVLGSCVLTQDYDADEFWQLVETIDDVDAIPIPYTFLRDPLSVRPTEEADSVDYRLRIWGKRNTHTIEGRFSNVVSAQRLPRRPDAPKGIKVRQLGYDYYDRLLICCELSPQDVPGTYAVQFAAGRLNDVGSFVEFAEQATLIGPQAVGDALTMYDSLPIGRNFQTDRAYTVGVARINAAGTFGPPAIAVVTVPVE